MTDRPALPAGAGGGAGARAYLPMNPAGQRRGPQPAFAAAFVLVLVCSCEVPAARDDEMQRTAPELPAPISMVHTMAARAIGKNTAVRNRARGLAISRRPAAASMAHRPTVLAISCSMTGISSSWLSRVKIVKSDASRGSDAR